MSSEVKLVKTQPEDPTSVANLAATGLRYSLVDTDDAAAFGAWAQADMRGFLEPRAGVDGERWFREGVANRRTIGVYDDSLTVDADAPVATISSWVAELTIPGSSTEHPRTLPSWAVSSVTVAPTHRRRGIARNLLEGELRTAAALGIPMAMLTVSESAIYGRFGFAPAAMAADWTIDTRRAKWIGPETLGTGRVEFVSIERWRAEAAALHERTRLESPGEIPIWELRWDQIAGLKHSDEARSKAVRAVHFTDLAGETRGALLYRMTGGDIEFAQHTVSVEYLVTETPDAAAGLWRFLLELDLTTEVKAGLRRADEPVRWQIADFRAAKVDTVEHQYLRVLDMAAAFEARSYLAAGELVFSVTDSLGFAEGLWHLVVEPVGSTLRASVTRLDAIDAIDAIPDATPALAMTANELAAIYLGGVPITTLLDAGRVTELSSGSAAVADALLRTARAPWLSFWY